MYPSIRRQCTTLFLHIVRPWTSANIHICPQCIRGSYPVTRRSTGRRTAGRWRENNSPSRPLGSAISSWKGYERRCVNVPRWTFLWILQRLPWFHGLRPGPVLRKCWTGGNMLRIRHTVHILHTHSFRRICHARAYILRTGFQGVDGHLAAAIIHAVMELLRFLGWMDSPAISRCTAMACTAENDFQSRFCAHYFSLPSSTGSASKSSALEPSPLVAARSFPSTYCLNT